MLAIAHYLHVSPGIKSSMVTKVSYAGCWPSANAHLWGFFTPPVAGADLRAALVASCLRGALPPVDLRAVCFVRAMMSADLGCERAATQYSAQNLLIELFPQAESISMQMVA